MEGKITLVTIMGVERSNNEDEQGKSVAKCIICQSQWQRRPLLYLKLVDLSAVTPARGRGDPRVGLLTAGVRSTRVRG